MGQAQASVENRTAGNVCVITFNKSDVMFTNYVNLYILEPKQKMMVEASPDPVGLYVGIVYKLSEKTFHYKRWLCKNESAMIIRSVSGHEIIISGGIIRQHALPRHLFYQ
jgi:hypothetical protein